MEAKNNGNQVPPDPLSIILAGRRAAGCVPPANPPPGQQERGEPQPQQYLWVTIGGVECGIGIMEIREIIRPRPVTEIPGSPPFLPGVISLRGTIIPILDTALRLGVRRSRAAGRERVVVVSGPAGPAGLLVERVRRVVGITCHDIQRAETFAGEIAAEYVAGIGGGDRTLVLLDAGKVAEIAVPQGVEP